MNFAGQSDKGVWHGYIDFYEKYFPGSIGGLIVELGVFKGDSIRWLSERFKMARIIGADILEQQESWPTGEQISYRRLDQGSEAGIASFFKEIEAPELIIEDGSHIPSHQSRCFKHGFAALKPGGMYALEDINTSLPQHPIYRKSLWKSPRLEKIFRKFQRRKAKYVQTSLSVILAFEHLKKIGKEKPSPADLENLCKTQGWENPYFSEKELSSMYEQIDSIRVYRRAALPTACYKCGSTEFDYNAYRCKCGVGLYDLYDSMTALITKKR